MLRGLSLPRIANVIVDHHRSLAAIVDTGFAGQDIVRDNGATNAFAQFDLGFVFAKLAPADNHAAALDLQSVAALLFSVPLHKGAIAKPHGAFAGNFGDLIAGSPESAIHKADRAG